MLIPNSRPSRPQPAVFAAAEGRRAPPPQSTRSPSRSIEARSASSLIASPWNPSSATSRFEPEPITPTGRPSASAQRNNSTSSASDARAGEPVGGAAGADRGQPGQRVVPLGAGGRRRAHPPSSTRASPSLKTSPAPIVTRTGPRSPCGGEAGGAVDQVGQGPLGAGRLGQPPDPPSPDPLRRRPRDVEAADPGQLADRLLAGRVDVEHGDFVGQRQGGAELLGERLGARVEVRLEDRDQARRAAVRAGPRAPPGPRSGGGRSRHICGRRCGSPSAPGAGGPPGSRRAPRRPLRRRGRRGRSRPGRRGRWRGCAGRAPRAAARPGRGRPASKPATASPLDPGVERSAARCRSPRPASASTGRTTPAAGSSELLEGGVQLGQRAPAGVVVHLDVGDDGDLGRQPQEAGVALVGLGDDPLALAPAGVGGGAVLADPRHLAADEEGRVGADRPQRPDRHRRRRRLAVGAGDRDQPLLGAELGQQGAAVDRLDPALAGQRQLRVARRRSRSRRPPRRPRAGSRRRGRPPARARPRAGAPYKRSRERSLPVTVAPSRAQTSASPLIPAPPMPMKCSRRAAPVAGAAHQRRRQYLVGDPAKHRDAQARARPRPSPPAAPVAEHGRRPRRAAARRSAPRRAAPSRRRPAAIQAALALWWSAVACG